MKQGRFLLLFLLPMIATAQQTTEVTSDTTYLEWDLIPEDWTGGDDSIFYEVRTVTYSNGRQETVREAVGDTVTTVSFFTNRSVDINRQTAQAAQIVIQRPAVVRAVRVSDKALLNANIGSVYNGLDSLFWREYLNAAAAFPYQQAYTARSAGTNFAATMRRLANGNIRLSFNSVNYQVLIYSDNWIRVRDFPISGQNTDLFRTGKNRWESVAGTSDGVNIVPALRLTKN